MATTSLNIFLLDVSFEKSYIFFLYFLYLQNFERLKVNSYVIN